MLWHDSTFSLFGFARIPVVAFTGFAGPFLFSTLPFDFGFAEPPLGVPTSRAFALLSLLISHRPVLALGWLPFDLPFVGRS
jgi:hypothetical protein